MGEIKNQPNAYFAGLFDGEGCVYICKHNESHVCRGNPRDHYSFSLRVVIGNNCLPVLEACASKYGGAAGVGGKNAETGTYIYRWQIGSKKAAEFLVAIRSYSIIKRDEIDTALRYMREFPNGAYKRGRRPEELVRQEELRAELKTLKRKWCNNGGG